MPFFVGEKMTGGYGGPDIISSCTVNVNRGEIVAILGPNGAGKSTAMKAMLGLLNLKSGKVIIDGKDISKLTPQDRVKEGIAFVPQTRNVFTGLSVEENLEMGAYLRDERFEEWHLGKRNIDHLDKPPQGIFYNRMSASSHTRGHRYAPEFTAIVLNWLEKNKRRIINNSKALSLEVSKSLQYKELESFGIKTPKTIYCSNKESILKSANIFRKPFITKHNRGGKGLGVKLFNNKKELDTYVSGKDFDPSIDGITLLQEYIDARPKVIIRAEFVNSKFLYAVEVDASDGFELCPACPEDQINVPETQFFGEYCPTIGNKFRIIKNYKRNKLIENYEKFIKKNGIEIAGIEYVTDKNGIIYTYDINTNTNYNSQAEKSSEIKGMKSIAKFLKEELLLLNNIRVVA